MTLMIYTRVSKMSKKSLEWMTWTNSQYWRNGMKKLRQQNLSFKDKGSRESNFSNINIKRCQTIAVRKINQDAMMTARSHHPSAMGASRKADAWKKARLRKVCLTIQIVRNQKRIYESKIAQCTQTKRW